MLCRIFSGVLVGAALLIAATPGGAAATPVAAVEYRLELRIDPAAQLIEGVATLAFPVPTAPPSLQLAPQALIDSVRADGREAAFTFRAGHLDITDDVNAAVSQIAVAYRARFDDPVPLDTVGIEDPSYGVRATIQPQGAFLAEGVSWFPRVAGVRGSYRVRVTAPLGMVAVTAGRFAGSRTDGDATVSEWRCDFPLEGLALAAGRFQMTQADLDGIQLLTFLSADNAGLADAYQAAMRRHLIFYRELLGPYPFAKFAVVENFLPTGYGLPSWTLLGSSVVRLPFLLDTSLPHEIVHSWWGNAVEVDYTHGNWAEGLATYLADYLLKEQAQPVEALAYRRKILRDYAALVGTANDFPLRDFTGRMARYQQAVGYGKGAMVFHMLRGEIGDPAFREGLRQMAATGIGRSLGWPDLEAIFARAAGRDLRWFFRQWVTEAGAPQLVLEVSRLERGTAGWVIDGNLRQIGTPYRLTVPLRLTAAGGETVTTRVELTGAAASFRLLTSGRPLRLEADPEVALFRRLAAEELPPTVNDLLTPNRPLAVVAAGQPLEPAPLRTLLKGLRWEAADIVMESAVTPAALADRDVLLVGWPRRPELQPLLRGGLAIDPSRHPGWRREGADGAGDVLFVVLARRQERRGSRALIMAATPEAGREVVTKIPHYGRYSLLTFAAGRNLDKSTWEPEQSPLVYTFPKEN